MITLRSIYEYVVWVAHYGGPNGKGISWQPIDENTGRCGRQYGPILLKEHDTYVCQGSHGF